MILHHSERGRDILDNLVVEEADDGAGGDVLGVELAARDDEGVGRAVVATKGDGVLEVGVESRFNNLEELLDPRVRPDELSAFRERRSIAEKRLTDNGTFLRLHNPSEPTGSFSGTLMYLPLCSLKPEKVLTTLAVGSAREPSGRVVGITRKTKHVAA